MKKKPWSQLQKRTKTALFGLVSDVWSDPDELEDQITWYLKEVPEQDKADFTRRANKARKLNATWVEMQDTFDKVERKIEQQVEKLLE
jgi:hypothetical protein